MSKRKKKKTASGRKQSFSQDELSYLRACSEIMVNEVFSKQRAGDEDSVKKAMDEFNNSRQNFIMTKTLKIFCGTQNEEIALRALELLNKTAQSF